MEKVYIQVDESTFPVIDNVSRKLVEALDEDCKHASEAVRKGST